ncbi:metal ion binding [Ascochyta rabiei]|uniref:Metal ion binding n=1 Tax=Didymella rabiei TaxID=5454 RepID=A0A162WBJ2_DIDRA|nr:metal ion binding [Ascochyta rabiei]
MYFATNAVTKDISPTTAGHGGQVIPQSRQFSTVVRQVSQETAHMLLNATRLAFQAMLAVRDSPACEWWWLRQVRSYERISWKVNMGPLQNHLAGVKPNPRADGLGYNPRCLSRDISKQAASETTDGKIAFLIKNSTEIRSFQDLMQNFVPGSVGIHSGGHYIIGGDAASDLYNSPADPAFF